jgi:phosphatidylserine decarboxylase
MREIVVLLALALFVLVLQFFRHPARPVPRLDDTLLYAPADGKVVVVEQTIEQEYFKEPRLQVSIFMSPLNVHVNRTPVSGEVVYAKYHPGRYLFAWNPKSSTDNERTTLVLRTTGGTEILLRQIAGALARRIVCYPLLGERLSQGAEFGFIKFGSRVDIFLPLETELQVRIGDVVKANRTVIGKIRC